MRRSPAISAWPSERDRSSMALRPILVWKVIASPKPMMAGSSRWPNASNVREMPIAPG